MWICCFSVSAFIITITFFILLQCCLSFSLYFDLSHTLYFTWNCLICWKWNENIKAPISTSYSSGICGEHISFSHPLCPHIHMKFERIFVYFVGKICYKRTHFMCFTYYARYKNSQIETFTYIPVFGFTFVYCCIYDLSNRCWYNIEPHCIFSE